MSKTLIVLLVILQIAVGLFIYRAGQNNIKTKWQAERLETFAAYNEAINASFKREAALRERMAQRHREASNEISNLERERDRLIVSMRNRPARPDTLPETPTTDSAGCTGANLFDRDAEFLARLAADADRTRIALMSCVDAYEELRED